MILSHDTCDVSRRTRRIHKIHSRITATRLALFLRDRSCFRYHVLYLDGEQDVSARLLTRERTRASSITELSRMTYGSRHDARAKPPLYLDSKVRAQRASCYDINCRLSCGNYLSMCTRRAIDRDSRPRYISPIPSRSIHVILTKYTIL